jgi:hypothetical protein
VRSTLYDPRNHPVSLFRKVIPGIEELQEAQKFIINQFKPPLVLFIIRSFPLVTNTIFESMGKTLQRLGLYMGDGFGTLIHVAPPFVVFITTPASPPPSRSGRLRILCRKDFGSCRSSEQPTEHLHDVI